MTTTWTKYVITGKRYDSKYDRIEYVRMQEYSDGKLGTPKTYSRQQVLKLLDSDERVMTAFRSENGQRWSPGEDVHAVQGKYARYIRSDRDQTEADNLGDLEEF